MKTVTSANRSLELSTERVAASSRQQRPGAAKTAVFQDESSAAQVSGLRREVPMPDDAEFVISDGKKYFLNVPRGTYVNILV